ncbi:MAG: DUF5615 family PIN-like protein [Balneolales bacterium]
MKVLIDAQLSPSIAAWINKSFGNIKAISTRSVKLNAAEDKEIYLYAKHNGYVIMSKDDDFLRLIEQHGMPPQLIWVTCGNTSNAEMKAILLKTILKVKDLIENGEAVVEISDY